jgi:hypothetical protein
MMKNDEPHARVRQRVLRELRTLGFTREHTSGPSAYYVCDDASTHHPLRVRVSDHEVPLTGDRSAAGFTWALGWNVIISKAISWRASYRELVEFKVHVADCKVRMLDDFRKLSRSVHIEQ